MKLLTFAETDIGALCHGTDIKGVHVPAEEAWIVIGDDGKELARGGRLGLIGRDTQTAPVHSDQATYFDKIMRLAKKEKEHVLSGVESHFIGTYKTRGDFIEAAGNLVLSDAELLAALRWYELSYERRELIILHLITKLRYLCDGGSLGIQTGDEGKTKIAELTPVHPDTVVLEKLAKIFNRGDEFYFGNEHQTIDTLRSLASTFEE